jgi:hypothetical protein
MLVREPIALAETKRRKRQKKEGQKHANDMLSKYRE